MEMAGWQGESQPIVTWEFKPDGKTGPEFQAEMAGFVWTNQENSKKRKRYNIIRDSGPCAVCGGQSSGNHYTVRSCEGCKGFFKRTIQRGLSQVYTCRGSEDCPVIVPHQKRCQRCRYLACTRAGMDPGRVMEERDEVKGVDDPREQKEEEKSEENMEPQECRHCHDVLLGTVALKAHIQKHHRKKTGKPKAGTRSRGTSENLINAQICGFCKIFLPDSAALKAHMEKEHRRTAEERRTPCILCGAPVAPSSLARHLAADHSISHNSSYVLAGGLMDRQERDAFAAVVEAEHKHKEGDMEEGEEEVLCPLCGLGFRDIRELEGHTRACQGPLGRPQGAENVLGL
jgi:hypothetical protein